MKNMAGVRAGGLGVTRVCGNDPVAAEPPDHLHLTADLSDLHIPMVAAANTSACKTSRSSKRVKSPKIYSPPMNDNFKSFLFIAVVPVSLGNAQFPVSFL